MQLGAIARTQQQTPTAAKCLVGATWCFYQTCACPSQHYHLLEPPAFLCRLSAVSFHLSYPHKRPLNKYNKSAHTPTTRGKSAVPHWEENSQGPRRFTFGAVLNRPPINSPNSKPYLDEGGGQLGGNVTQMICLFTNCPLSHPSSAFALL